MRWARRIFRMVEAATRCPSRHSSPWILTTPHRAFSRARRTISATSSSGNGGRPGALGWRHLAATSRRCQRISVPGVTIRRARSPLGMILASAARTARSVQDIRGPGFVRRSTATSCRSASISTSLADENRASSAGVCGSATRYRPTGRGDRPEVSLDSIQDSSATSSSRRPAGQPSVVRRTFGAGTPAAQAAC